jgi:hypothetical protein
MNMKTFFSKIITGFGGAKDSGSTNRLLPQIPKEIWIGIFDSCELIDLYQISQVCSMFRKLITSNFPWRLQGQNAFDSSEYQMFLAMARESPISISKELSPLLHYYEAKIVIIGEGNCGKSTFFATAIKGKQLRDQPKYFNIGVDIQTTEFEIEGGNWHLQLWESRQEKFR